MADDSEEFSITIPDCQPGAVLKATAPDGCALQIPLPESLRAGDVLTMKRGEDGQWTVSRALRGAPPAAAAAEFQKGSPARTAALAQGDDSRWTGPWRSPETLAADLAGPGVVTVRLETTKGPIELRVVPSWAPLGVRRLLRLIDEGYYTDIAIYRGIRGGLVQFGIVQETDPRSSVYQPLEDDPLVGVPYEEGAVSFAAAGPGTRTATLCIMLGDFRDQLGRSQPETVIGRVRPEFMGTLHSLFTGYGDIPQQGGAGPDPAKLAALGNEYIRTEFPRCDFILRADRFYDPRWV
eukprot:TRINITY_DN45780_c0_g1_i1.p1 TRINITY_DN45780_c0_g1~~TRINITY_DN45780_c0_g1_i1.p1  ORF type:complete len:312 (-),score=34.17 TRINITY_DN45780_c0_g1_i1:88-969(-)